MFDGVLIEQTCLSIAIERSADDTGRINSMQRGNDSEMLPYIVQGAAFRWQDVGIASKGKS
jgi:hypothetical protein